MRIRKHLVSNSSSTSFVISKEAYPGIWDVVIAMLSVRDDDRVRDFGRQQAELYDDGALKRAVINDNEDVKKENVVFPSRNFDTHVHDAGDSWWIATCNNHPFFALFHDDGANCETETEFPSDPYYESDVREYIQFHMEKDHDFYEV